jgi:hypothetical protein
VDDIEAHIFWANWKGLTNEGSSTSAYFVYMDVDCNTPAVATCAAGAAAGSADFYTLGGRQAAKHGKMTYRGEFYYQAGKSGAVGALTTPGSTGDQDSYMFGLRASWNEANVTGKPMITLWYDYLSGTSQGDAAAGDNGTFNTLFDTGHKFYGFMDFFLATPVTGLHDIAIKFKTRPYAKTTLKLDLHHFAQTTQTVGGTACATCSPGSRSLGQELDFTAIYKYTASTKFVTGYSHFFTKDAFNGVAQGDDQDWFYVMIDLKF